MSCSSMVVWRMVGRGLSPVGWREGMARHCMVVWGSARFRQSDVAYCIVW